MAYVLPSLKVYQEFVPVLAGNFVPLYSCVIAPQYALHRFEYEDERELLGTYNVVAGNVFTGWPGKSAGSVIDIPNSELWAEDAVLKYASVPDANVTVDGGTRVYSPTWVFKTANNVDRSGALGTRDVNVGDYCSVAGPGGTVVSKVVSLIADVVPSEVEANVHAVAHVNTTLANVVVETLDSVDITADATTYDGLASGDPSETYTCEVLSAPTVGAVTGAVIRVISDSHRDDVAELVLADGVEVDLGTRGAKMTVSTTSSSSGSLLVGDTWVVNIAQNYTAPTLTEGGTYTGRRDTKYLLTIVTGGVLHADVIRYVVSTTNGYDITPIRTIPATGTGAVSIPVGNYGVTISIPDNAPLCGNDIWTIEVIASTQGAVHTIQLANRLTGIVTGDSLSLTLGLYDTIEVDEGNWLANTTTIEVIPDANHQAAYLGVVEEFPILAGSLYIAYREQIMTNVGTISVLTDLAAIPSVAGPIAPENPLGIMVYAALSQSNGTPVYCIATRGNAAADYIEACDKLADNEDVYGLVPYDSGDAAVRAAVQAHVNDMSDPLKARFRIAWFGLNDVNIKAVSTETTGGSELETTISTLTVSAVDGQFVTDEVRPGDMLRTNYRLSPTGALIYDAYEVDYVVAEDELVLLTGPAAPIIVPIKTEIWRTLTNTEYADEMSATAVSHKSRRIYCIWSESFSMAGFANLPKSVLAASLAGQRSAVAPHQPLTNVEMTGIGMTDVVNMSAFNLNSMAGNGIWLVVRDIIGRVYTRHQVSTDPSDINTREQTVTTNLDTIVRECRDNVKDLYGRGNATQAMINLIDIRLRSTAGRISGRVYPPTIGPQLVDFQITRLEIDPLVRDAVLCEIEPILPYPLNNLTLRFRIV